MNDKSQLFTSEELRKNDEKRNALVDLLQSGDGIFMAGAGCTASLYPPWSDFLNRMYAEAIEFDSTFPTLANMGGDFLKYADLLKERLGEESYHRHIHQNFTPGEKKYEKVHECICRFLHLKKIRGIITTNYDQVLEYALTGVTKQNSDYVWIDKSIEKARIFEFLLSLNDDHIVKRIFHLHGVCHVPESIILSESEYESRYGFRLRKPAGSLYDGIKNGGLTSEQFNGLLKDYAMDWPIHRKILWSFFATRKLIFLGFSLADPYFNKMLDFVSSDLHLHGYSMHYLVLRIKNEQEKDVAFKRALFLKKNFGIETVFFQENDNNTGFNNFMYNLENDVFKTEQIPTSISKSLETEDVSDEEITKMLIAKNRRR